MLDIVSDVNDEERISAESMPKRKSALLTPRQIVGHLIIASAMIIIIALVVIYSGRKCTSADNSPVVLKSEDQLPATTVKPIVKDVRLPKNLRPIHYEIRLLPWMEEGNFTTSGFIEVLMECVEQTNKIVLHSAEIEIDRMSVQVTSPADADIIQIDHFEEDLERQFFIIHLKNHLLISGYRYVLSMNFTGILNDQQRGFHRISYHENGVKKYVALTQMQPVDARRAFPCFDEPNFKAEFSIILGRQLHMISLSNMPKKKTTPITSAPGYEWDYFERSVSMSSYLVAMIVADYSFTETTANDKNVTFRVWARHSAINQTKYSSDIGPKMLQFFQEYFDIHYPLPKQDMIALPDFPGAMENWGLITFGEQQLLYDPDMPSEFHREMIAQVIAHEQAHQWFGNLVTMEWWNDLWLNEGFASYMSYIGANHFEPSYRLCQQFVINEVQSVMAVDGYTNSHPINQPVHHPDEINQIFDRISYNKGAAIVRMLAAFLGHQTFQRGLSYYLKSRMYGNAVQDDLWTALTYQAEMDFVELPTNIKTIMDSWTLKMGFPVVSVTRNYASGIITARQERFLLDLRSSNSTFRWWIPLLYSLKSSPDVVNCYWIPEHEDEVEITLEANESQWILFNVDQVGFYRVNYDERNWNLIIQQLIEDPREISVINRAQLIDDAFNLARAGLLDYSVTFNLTRYLRYETEYVAWRSAATGIKFLDSMLCHTKIYGDFQDYIIRMVDGLFRHTSGIHGDNKDNVRDDPLRVHMQTIAWRLACHFHHCDCTRSAIKLYSDWIDDPEQHVIPTHLKSIVSCTAIARGGHREWEFAYFKFNTSNSAAEKDDMLEAMSCSNQVWILKLMLDWTLKGLLTRTDSSNLFLHFVRNPLGRYLTFDFLTANWNDMMKSHRLGITTISNLLEIATESFNTPAELNFLKKFYQIFEEKSNDQTWIPSRTFDQLVERIEANILWLHKFNETVGLWLSEQNSDTFWNNRTKSNSI